MKLLTSWLDAWLSADQRSLVVALPGCGPLAKVITGIVVMNGNERTVCVSLEILSNTSKESFSAKMGT